MVKFNIIISTLDILVLVMMSYMFCKYVTYMSDKDILPAIPYAIIVVLYAYLMYRQLYMRELFKKIDKIKENKQTYKQLLGELKKP